MPHSAIKLIPGVDQNETQALNQAAISQCNFIRFIYDKAGQGLVQKLGGWTAYYSAPMSSITRALWAWEDTNSVSYLALGNEASLNTLSNGSLRDLTPRTATTTPAIAFSTTAGSSIVQITDPGFATSSYDSVFIETPISVGGLVLFGLYPVTEISNTTYSIQALTALGLPAPATSTASGGVAPQFATTSGSAVVTVTLPSHGYAAGDTFPVLVSTPLNGVTLFGNYTVQSVSSTSVFTIQAATLASATGSIYEAVSFLYYVGLGPVPAGTGFGVGGFGTGGFGSGTAIVPTTGTPITAVDWTLDNFGQILLACPVTGPIYQWDPTSGNVIATVLPFGPPVNDGMFVAMPQRQVIAWGSSFNGVQDPLLLRWCDVENFNDWIAKTTNQAGSYRIPKGSRIVGCIQGPQQALVWTDLSIWAMQYVGQPFIYQFNEIATGCGLIGRKAAGSYNGVVYWMGQTQFYQLSGGGVEPIACPIWDVIFQDLDKTNLNKIRVAVNSRFAEVAWYYPTTTSGGEVAKYVKYNAVLRTWDYGSLGRSAWINESVLGAPIGASPSDRYIYQHETSPDAASGAQAVAMNSYFQTGYFAINEGDLKSFIDQMWPDAKWGYYNGSSNPVTTTPNPSATLNLTFYVADYPGDTPSVYGPYQVTRNTTFISPRFRGRLVSIAVGSSDIGTWWRIGNMRYRVMPDGKY
jgi:hypothetical protein